MLRKVASGVAWVGRTASMVFGLALVLALVFGTLSVAAAHTGSVGLFHLGHNNPVTAASTLAGNLAGKVLQVSNTGTANGSAAIQANNKSPLSPAVRAINSGGGPALGLSVGAGKAPLTVNASAGKATNLDADKVDGKDESAFLGKTEKAADSDLLDGQDASAFLPANGKAQDADQLDGQDSSAFSLSGHDHDGRYYTETESDGRFVNETDHHKSAHDALDIDADTLDGLNSSSFASGTNGKANDADKLDNQNSTAFAGTGKSSYVISVSLNPCTENVIGSHTISPSRSALVYASGAAVYDPNTSNLTAGTLRLELRNATDTATLASGPSMAVNGDGGELPLSVQGVLMSGTDLHRSFTPYEVTPGNSYVLRLVANTGGGTCAGSPQMSAIALSHVLIGT